MPALSACGVQGVCYRRVKTKESIVATASMPNVKLRVTISIDIDARDYLEAAEHQKKIESYLSSVQAEYPGAEILVKERRGPRPESGASRAVRVRSGRLRAYD